VLESDGGREVLGLDAPWTTLSLRNHTREYRPTSGCTRPAFSRNKTPSRIPLTNPPQKIMG
jgi:hypothetical protein